MDTSERDPGNAERGPQAPTDMKTVPMERTSMASHRVTSGMGAFASTAQEKWGTLRRMVFDAKLFKRAYTPGPPPYVANVRAQVEERGLNYRTVQGRTLPYDVKTLECTLC